LRRVEVTPRHVTWLTLTTRPAERERGGGGRQEEDGEVEGEGVEEEVVAAWIPPSVSDKCRRRKARASVPTSASFSATSAWPASSTQRTWGTHGRGAEERERELDRGGRRMAAALQGAVWTV
jgi:hypothetical protein